jgi:hypothetical protein
VRAILIGVLGAGLLAYLFARPPAITTGGIDFNAFYCAARTLSAGANPYSYEPLHACEHEHWRRTTPSSIVPAPLPPYALALLVPIASLPYAQAAVLWFILLVAAALVMIWAVIELTNLPFLAVGIPIVIAVLLQSLPTGSLAPIPLALLSGAAVTLTCKQWNLTALLLALACIEPHVAGPVLLATLLLVREMRVRIALVASALLLLSFVAGGVGLSAQYFNSVLPAHAIFELGSVVQFGLSSMLHNFGVPDRAAIAIGAAQYACFVLLGILLAASLRHRIPAMVVLVPMALAVTGGVYIHLTQIAAVLPLAFVAASQTRSAIAWAGIGLLTVPWNLLNALTPNALVVPPLADVASRTLTGQYVHGELAYVANALVYSGIACVFWGALAALANRQRLNAPRLTQ